jgi:hypothetical protein
MEHWDQQMAVDLVVEYLMLFFSVLNNELAN